jgi:hypothetical protein
MSLKKDIAVGIDRRSFQKANDCRRRWDRVVRNQPSGERRLGNVCGRGGKRDGC